MAGEVLGSRRKVVVDAVVFGRVAGLRWFRDLGGWSWVSGSSLYDGLSATPFSLADDLVGASDMMTLRFLVVWPFSCLMVLAFAVW